MRRRIALAPRSPAPRQHSATFRRAARLPCPLTDLLGRERELEASRRQLLDPHVRLLTFTGAPGTGKTRLALALAEDIRREFPDGVWFVPLAALQQPDLVLPTISQALDVRQMSGRSPADTLARALRGRWLLLILDNFEHLLPASAVIAKLLEGCRELTVLATSRAPLNVRGEHRFPVSPLDVPSLTPLPPLHDLEQVPSVQLFLERAAAVRPDFRLSAPNAPAVAEVCVRLGGLPLAIELAAARSALLDPADLLARLDRWLPLLADGPRDVPARHRTLRTAIAWSYDLLWPEQQRLFRCLGAFPAGCALETLESVIRAPAEPAIDVLASLAHLVDHSLVRKESQVEAEPRVSMLEPIREFALEQLAACGELDAVQRRHAEYFVDMAEAVAPPRLDGPDGPALLARLDRENDNLRAALRWLVDHGEGEASVRLAGALWSFWEMRGHWSEGLLWIESALERGQTASPATRARALTGAAALRRTRGDREAAAALARQSVAIRRELGDQAGLAQSLVMLADMLCMTDPLSASEAGAEGLAIRRERGDEVGTVWALVVLGNLALARADFAAARAHLEEAMALRAGRPANMVDVHLLRNLGALYSGAGNVVAARRLLTECLTLSTTVWGSIEGVILVLLTLGELELRLGETEAGKARLEECRKRASEAGASVAIVISSFLLRSPLPEGFPQNLGEDLLTASWRQALGREMPNLAGLRSDADEPPARPARSVPDALTPREIEVLALLARHFSNREIADELVLSVRTVERHLANIYSKIGVSGRRLAAAFARQHGITTDGGG